MNKDLLLSLGFLKVSDSCYTIQNDKSRLYYWSVNDLWYVQEWRTNPGHQVEITAPTSQCKLLSLLEGLQIPYNRAHERTIMPLVLGYPHDPSRPLTKERLERFGFKHDPDSTWHKLVVTCDENKDSELFFTDSGRWVLYQRAKDEIEFDCIYLPKSETIGEAYLFLVGNKFIDPKTTDPMVQT